jgi:hypothetical protein
MVYYVVCINKSPNHSDPHSRIQHVGTSETRAATTYSKRWTVAGVIAAIRSSDVFYSSDSAGDLVKVIIATHLGRDYIKTENDGIQPDNLLAKPECT